MHGVVNFELFLATAVLLNMSPGPDSLYIAGRTIAQGRSAGIVSVLGISTGGLLHTLFAALGLSAILMASAMAFSIIKWAGAIYLTYLGVRMFFKGTAAEKDKEFPIEALCKIYFQALATNILNPKVALFFLALIPQFISATAPYKTMTFVLLGLTFVITGTLWCLFLALGASLIAKFLRKSGSGRSLMDKMAGGLFIFLGIRLATQQR